MVIKVEALAEQQAGIRHICLPGKGLLGEEQGALHMDVSCRHLAVCICSASETQLAVSSPGWLGCAVVLNPGVKSPVWWQAVPLSLYEQHMKGVVSLKGSERKDLWAGAKLGGVTLGLSRGKTHKPQSCRGRLWNF